MKSNRPAHLRWDGGERNDGKEQQAEAERPRVASGRLDQYGEKLAEGSGTKAMQPDNTDRS